MKKLIAGMVMLLAVPFSSQASQEIGIFLGSPMSGIQYKTGDMRFSLGLQRLGFAFDKTFNLGSLSGNSDLNALYTYLGAQVTDKSSETLGVRGGIGFQVPINSVSLYGEIGPTVYVMDQVGMNLEAAVGAR